MYICIVIVSFQHHPNNQASEEILGNYLVSMLLRNNEKTTINITPIINIIVGKYLRRSLFDNKFNNKKTNNTAIAVREKDIITFNKPIKRNNLM